MEGPAVTGTVSDGEVTRLLDRLKQDESAYERLASLIFRDVHRIARNQQFDAGSTPTLQTTAIVNEAFLKVFQGRELEIENRAHLLRIMARAVRQVIVDHVRGRMASKRGGEAVRLELEEERLAGEDAEIARVLDMERALERLGNLDPELVDLVAGRFYAGMTTADLAELAGVSRRTVQRELSRACGWLRLELSR